jgi:hypothetical protein
MHFEWVLPTNEKCCTRIELEFHSTCARGLQTLEPTWCGYTNGRHTTWTPTLLISSAGALWIVRGSAPRDRWAKTVFASPSVLRRLCHAVLHIPYRTSLKIYLSEAVTLLIVFIALTLVLLRVQNLKNQSTVQDISQKVSSCSVFEIRRSIIVFSKLLLGTSSCATESNLSPYIVFLWSIPLIYTFLPSFLFPCDFRPEILYALISPCRRLPSSCSVPCSYQFDPPFFYWFNSWRSDFQITCFFTLLSSWKRGPLRHVINILTHLCLK